MKKNLTTLAIALCGLSLLTGCDKGFEDLNTNPDASNVIRPEYVFTKSQYDAAGNMITGLQGTMQYTTSYNDVASWGSKYIFNQGTAPYTVFSNAYPNEINEIGEVIRAVEKDPAQVNKLAVARIWRVYAFSKITDLYGDIPYTQAGLGYTQSLFKPKYDAQKDIYADMLSELEKSVALFDASKATFGAADLVYGGDITKWKKFAYSLMLRLGMRMTKPDAASAETWVKKAIAANLLVTEDADIAKITYLASGQVINQNPLAYWMLNSDYLKADGSSNPEGGKFHETFINYLKKTGDPRLPVLSVVYVGGKPNNDPAIQKGMVATIPNTKPSDFVTYSEPNPATLLKLNAPMLILTNAEVNFYLAEAAVRGWYTGKTAAAAYDAGVKASMRQWALFGADGVIPQASIDAYATANALKTGTTASQLEQIYNQFWVSVFPNSQEVFLNWRRTGYPALTPNNYPGNITGGKIFRRMLYPASEENLNKENYNDAAGKLGGNTFLTQMWLDK